jgi:acetamidase/formamidase
MLKRLLRAARCVTCAGVLPGAALAQGSVHRLPATPGTVAYGYYWAEAKPALTIGSGDVIEVETLLTNTPTRLEAAGVAPGAVQQSLRDIVAQVTDRGPGGHILTGPVFVEGADSGDVLEVRIESVDLDLSYGYNGCSGFARDLCDRSQSTTRIIPLDATRMVGVFAPGIEVPLRPFFGSMGVAPPPALYIPVHVRGALFEVGDGHAAQGDGEVDQTAIETSLRGRLRLTVRKDMRLTWPQAETPTHWITMGTDTSLVRATRIAIDQMVQLLMQRNDLTQTAAYQLASIVADLRITQLVDGNVGVHMMVPKRMLLR